MCPSRDHPDTLVYSSERGPRRADTRVASAPAAARPSAGVRIWLEKKGRNGKPVSIVRGLALDPGALAALAARLKRACSSGGTVKDGEIIIQGNHRTQIATVLARDGLRAKLAGA